MKDSITVIYGAGDYGLRLYGYFNKNNISVDFFAQTIIDRTGLRVMDRPLIGFADLIEIKTVCRVYIAVNNKDESRLIKEDLMDNGFKDDCVYECGEFIKHNLTDQRCKPITYNNHPYEVDMAKTYWKKYFDSKVILTNSKKALIDGLDAIDCIQIENIVNRMKNLPFNKAENDIFTNDEKRSIRRIEREFQPSTCGELMEWQGWRIPQPYYMEPLVFFYKCGAEEIKDCPGIRDRNIIDCGAFIGDSSIVLSEYTDRKVFAFEASRKNYLMINYLSRLNGVNNVVPENYALSDRCGEDTLFLTASGRTNALSKSATEAITYLDEEKVRTITIDKFVEENRVKVGLIKSDIEGAELKMLKGAVNTINQQRPALLISIYHSADDFFLIKKYIQENHGFYKFKVFQPYERTRILCDTILVCLPLQLKIGSLI